MATEAFNSKTNDIPIDVHPAITMYTVGEMIGRSTWSGADPGGRMEAFSPLFFANQNKN
jgi:hypothetical protein